MMNSVRQAFLQAQHNAGLALAESSEILDLTPVTGSPPDRYIADFRCRSIAREGESVFLVERVLVGIHLPENYLHVFEPQRVITVLAPLNLWHPNIRGSLLCPGTLPRGTPLADVLFQVFEVLAGYRLTLDERYALNPAVCAWARQNRHMYPIDPRPLRRRSPAAVAASLAEEVAL